MKYGKDRVIKIESDGSPDSDQDDKEEVASSDESVEDYLYSNNSDDGNETELDALTPIKNAIGYSIIKGMNIPRDEKQKFIERKQYC